MVQMPKPQPCSVPLVSSPHHPVILNFYLRPELRFTFLSHTCRRRNGTPEWTADLFLTYYVRLVRLM